MTSREAMDKIVDDHFMYEATADLEGVLRTYTEDPVHQVVGGPDGLLRGKTAIRGFYERLFPALKGERAEPVMPGKSGHARVRLLHVFQLRDGLIANERVWFDHDDMRRQLG